MENKDKKVITRFAPSPTGFMHIGNVRTALYAWLWARRNNGTFILRIEDTDKKREVVGSIDHIKETMKWLGMDWDEGPDIGGPNAPYIQSERMKGLDIYTKHANKLIENGFAYADTTSEEELDNLRKKAEEERKPFLFREYRPNNPPKWEKGMPLRFKIKELKRTNWNDVARGELSAGEEALDDFILIKSDGYPTYNFAHIVDDIEMGITHIIRGQEFISSTPNYIAVYEALGARQPIYVTAPPLLGESGNKKMGKRDGAKDTLEYRKDGFLPQAMVNFLVFLGFNPGGEKEIFTKQELIDVFDINKIQSSPAKVNEEKLLWMNKEHIKLLNFDEHFESILKWLPDSVKNLARFNEDVLRKITPILVDRISKWGDLEDLAKAGDLDYFFQKPDFVQKLLVWKEGDLETSKKHLKNIKEILDKTDDTFFETPEKIKSVLWDYAEKEGRGNVLWPLRVALTGKDKSPDPFTMLSVLGKKESLERITF